MEDFITNLQKEVQAKLDKIDPNIGFVKGYDEKVTVLAWAVTEMRHYPIKYPFPDKATEIKYFKHWLPSFYRQYNYFLALCQLELFKNAFPEGLSAYLESEKEKVTTFFRDHWHLYSYHQLRKSNEDHTLFVYNCASGDDQFLLTDINHCEASLNLGFILAYKDYRQVLDQEIILLTMPREAANDKRLKWAGNKTEAVEFLTLCFEAKLFDNSEDEPATLDQLKIWAREELNVDLKNFTVLDNAGRSRKKSTTTLLDKLIRVSKARENRLNP